MARTTIISMREEPVEPRKLAGFIALTYREESKVRPEIEDTREMLPLLRLLVSKKRCKMGEQ